MNEVSDFLITMGVDTTQSPILLCAVLLFGILVAPARHVMGYLLKGCWSLLQWPFHRLSRLRSGTRYNTATRHEPRVPTEEYTRACQEFRRLCAEKEKTQLTKKGSSISARGLLVGSERENSRSLVAASRHLFALMWQNERCLPSSPQKYMRLLLSETETDTLPVPYGLADSCDEGDNSVAEPNDKAEAPSLSEVDPPAAG